MEKTHNYWWNIPLIKPHVKKSSENNPVSVTQVKDISQPFRAFHSVIQAEESNLQKILKSNKGACIRQS